MKKILLLFFTLILTLAAVAQDRTVTGLVIGTDDNQPIVGATIQVKGSTVSTATDVNGHYSIKVTNAQNVVIGVKFIGYNYQEISLKPGENKLDFKIVPSNSSLSQVEVVATGYGVTQKAKILGSVSEIKAAEVEDLPVANLGTALMNRVAGVGISVASGKPGATTTLTLQGAYSATAGAFGGTTDPLYIIDGLIATKSDFDNLDASLLESIAFLKDAQAAIYGAAADKGVVLVTTKKGRVGKPQISYTGYFGTSNAAFRPKLLTGLQEAQTINDAQSQNNAALTSQFSPADLAFIATNPYPSWYDQLWHSSQTFRHTINISGGTDRVTFFGGGSYYAEGGNFGTTNVKKYNIRSGMQAKITDDVTAYISLNTNYESDSRNTAKSESNDTENFTFTAINQVPAWVPLTINGVPNYWAGPSAAGSSWNPLAYFNSNSYARNNTQTINLNSSIEFRPHQIKGLTAKVQFGKNNYLTNAKNYYPPYNAYVFSALGQNGALYSTTQTKVQTVSNSNQVYVGTGSSSEYELIGSLDYTKSIKNNNFDFLVVATQNETSQSNYNAYRTTQLIPGIDQLFAFDPTTTTLQNAAAVETGNLGYVGRMTYDYKSKYLFQLIDRIDGSSNFAPANRFGNSPAAAIGWRVSEEDFFKKYLGKYVSSFKIRYNIGITGDDRISPFLYESRFTPYTGTMLFGTTVTNGLDPSYVPNPDITWEHNRAQTLGFDATFFNDRLSVTAEIWNKHYYNGLTDASLVYPGTYGESTAALNYTTANTWGETFTIGYIAPIGKNWSINANINFGWGNSQLTQGLYAAGALGLPNEYSTVTIGELGNRYNGTNEGLIATGIIRTQAQLDALLAKNPNYTIEGKTPQIGWMTYQDLNGDGKILDTQDETVLSKGTAPAFASGITIGATYKSFRFNMNMFLQLGGTVTVADRTAPSSATSSSTGSLNEPFYWADHWTPANPNAAYPRTDSPDIGDNSTFWLRSGTSWYINNMTLSYTLPKSIADRFKIPSLRFLVTGENLWQLIDPYNYKDSRQTSIQSYPTLRTFSLGVNLTL